MHGTKADYRNQWGLEAIRADRAWAHLELEHGIGMAPGVGQTVGLIDTGIDAGHPAFDGKTISEHFFDQAQDETGDKLSHGTAVASVIAARQGAMFDYVGASPAHGVAWGADIAMFAVYRRARGDGPYEPTKSLTGRNQCVDDRWAAKDRLT